MKNKKTILITGGTTGIGFATAEYLLNNGYEVVITGLSELNMEEALMKLNYKATGIISDTSNLDTIYDLVETLRDKFDKIDGIFVNAGIFKSISLDNTTEALFDETMNVNFKGAYFLIQKCVSILNNPSSIVLNTSIAVFKAFADASIYTASKAALESLAKVFNLELASKGIRINIVSPGVTQTPIQQKSGMDESSIKNLIDHFSTTSPIGRIVQPSDIAPIVEFLVSDKSLVLRNEKIIVDGGTTM